MTVLLTGATGCQIAGIANSIEQLLTDELHDPAAPKSIMDAIGREMGEGEEEDDEEIGFKKPPVV